MAGEFGAGAEQQGTATAHVVGDVAEVGRGQDVVPVREPIEDDQVEIADLHLEQLADRKGDQREFVGRGEVVAIRRAQDGEVHQVDGRVGFEEAAPGAFAEMRLAGDEEDAEAVADAVDRDDGAVIERGDFAGESVGLEFDDGGAGAGDGNFDTGFLAYGDRLALRGLAVAADGQAREGVGGRDAEVVDWRRGW